MPVGRHLVKQDIEKKNSIDVTDLVGYPLIPEVAGDDFQLGELPRAFANGIRKAIVNEGSHGDIVLIKGVERVAAFDSPHPTEISK
jgi:hypothetical protein